VNELEFGFLGGGQMATAIAKGVVHAKVAAPSALAFYEPSAEQVAKIKNLFPEASLASSASELFDRSHRLILAVKPQVLEGIAMGLAPHVTPHHHLISIAAGIPLAKLTQWFRTERFTRVMPNTPCQCLQGASGIAHSHGVSDQDKEWTDRVFRSVGTVVGVTDEQLHAVTGVSGSGPAYVLMMIEALSDGGVASGLSRDGARCGNDGSADAGSSCDFARASYQSRRYNHRGFKGFRKWGLPLDGHASGHRCDESFERIVWPNTQIGKFLVNLG
jgi:pyrroline-5-carboxylate reductase